MHIKSLPIYKYFNFASSIGLPSYKEQNIQYWEIHDYWKSLPVKDELKIKDYFKFCRKRRKGRFEKRSIESFFELNLNKYATGKFMQVFNKLRIFNNFKTAVRKAKLINYNVYQ
jgi:hypothetical protein